MDVIFEGLAKSNYKDFEVVIVDNLHRYRDEIVAQNAPKYGVPYQHIPVPDSKFPVVNFQQCVNAGVRASRGDIVLITCDYARFGPDHLQFHADFHATHPNAGLISCMRIMETPKNKFPYRYGQESLPYGEHDARPPWTLADFARVADQYVADLEAGKFKEFLWSIGLEEPWIQRGPVEDKAGHPPGPCPPGYAHIKADSFPKANLLAIGGFDERFDGTHCYQDSEVAKRLARAGLQWHIQKTHYVELPDVHPLFTIRKMLRDPDTNRILYETC